MKKRIPISNYKLTRTCAVHSAGGRINLAMLNPPTLNGDDGGWNNIGSDGSLRPMRLTGYSLNVKPVFMQAPTVVGEDPYNAPQAPIRPRIIATPPPPPEEGEELAEGEMPPDSDETVAGETSQPAEGEDDDALAPIFRNSGAAQRPSEASMQPPAPPRPPDISQPRIPVYPGEPQPEGSRSMNGSNRTAPQTEELAPVFRARPVLPEVQEPGRPRMTEDGLPSVLEEVPRARRLEPPRAESIDFD